MPSLQDCIEAALDTGKVTKAQADELQGRVEAYERVFKAKPDMSPERALSEAEQAALKDQQFETLLRKRQAVLQAAALKKAIDNIEAHPAGKGTGVMSLLVKDLGRRAPYSNVDNRAHTILGGYHAQFADAMARFRTKNLGFSQDKDGLRNMVRELLGETTDDKSAGNFAKVYSELEEISRLRFNKAGGAIRKLTDRGLPQYHDAILVGKVKKEDWREFIDPLLSREKIVDEAGTPVSPKKYDEIMNHAYDSIHTDGLIDMVPGRMGKSKLANSRREHRVLHFKDADSWLKYHDRFGHQDIYTTLTDHLKGMAHDTALLEILGPNPDATYKHLKDIAKKAGYSKQKLSFLDSVYFVVSGKAGAVDNAKFADFMKGVRNYQVGIKLGSAFLSAISDTHFTRQTALYNGLDSVKVFKRALKLFNPLNAEDRLFAVKAQLTADAWVERGLAANRFTEVTGAGFSAKTADFTMRSSLLSPWTESLRHAFGQEFQAFIAESANKEWKALNKPLRTALKDYNITPDEWNVIRKVRPDEFKKVKFFSPKNLAETGDIKLMEKVQEMILTETDFAVPGPDSRTRALKMHVAGNAKLGSISRELSESGFMFKSFPISVIALHLYRGALQQGKMNKLKYLSHLTIGTTVMGAVALQMKDISRGRKPRDMDNDKFWRAAFLQGGGAGIFGDFIFADANRFGGGPIKTMAGPVASTADDLWGLTWGNLQQAAAGEDMELGADAVKLLRHYTPGGSLWYARLAYERAVLDQLQKAADPKASSKFRRIQRRRAKEYKQAFWWKPGEAAP